MIIRDLYKGYNQIYDNHKSITELIDNWYTFMEPNLDIRKMCIDDYENSNLDWKKVATEKVFSKLHYKYNEMEDIYSMINEIIVDIESTLNSLIDLGNIDIEFIIYHGLGNAAGRAEKIGDQYTILLGIEKIAELGWGNTNKLTDLIVHEYAHVAHEVIRENTILPYKEDKYKREIFHMYVEGLATYCEDYTNGRMKTSNEWYSKCIIKEKQLKEIYYANLFREGEHNLGFFGDWDEVFGLTETGYFMGYRVIHSLLEEYSLLEIMKLDYNTIEKAVLIYLKE